MPSTPNTLAGLLVQQTQTAIYQGFLSLATMLGLPVTSWSAGDPTRSTFFADSSFLATLERTVVGFIQSGFLDYAANPINDENGNPLPVDPTWLNLQAAEQFGVTVPVETNATTNVVLTNTAGGYYEIEPGDVQVQCSVSGATYTNTTSGVLGSVGGPNATLTVTVVADQAGSAGTAAAGAIDTIVTNLVGVTCTNPAAATGNAAPTPAQTIQQCRNRVGSMSACGPVAAYEFVALDSALTGVQTPTQVRVYPDSDTGQFPLYISGLNGTAIGSGDVAAVQAAINRWATPPGFQATVYSASTVTIPVTYSVWIYSSVNQTVDEIEAAIAVALGNFFAARPIGGDIIPPASTGFVYSSQIEAAIGAAFAQIFRVSASITPTMVGSPSLTFASIANTITRSSGSWLTDGFAVGQSVTVAGSSSNNGTIGPITALNATVMTVGSPIANEGPVSGVTIAGAFADTPLTNGQVAALGIVTATVNVIAGP